MTLTQQYEDMQVKKRDFRFKIDLRASLHSILTHSSFVFLKADFGNFTAEAEFHKTQLNELQKNLDVSSNDRKYVERSLQTSLDRVKELEGIVDKMNHALHNSQSAQEELGDSLRKNQTLEAEMSHLRQTLEEKVSIPIPFPYLSFHPSS